MAFFDDIPQALVVVGILILIIEVLALGFATFILTFLGISMITTGGLMYLGLLDETWEVALWVIAILTPLSGLILWKPLKNLQSQSSNEQVNSDFASEIEFELEGDVDMKGLTTYRYSGVEWKLKSQTPISKGSLVRVVKKDVGTMWVEAVI